MTENLNEPDTTDANPADLTYGVDDEATPADLPYKDDTSDGTTAKSPQEIAEETAHEVKSSDDLAREAAGIEHPAEGHDASEYEGLRGRHEDRAEAGDDEAVDEHGNDVGTADDKAE